MPTTAYPPFAETVLTNERDSERAGRDIGTRLHAAFGGESPDAVILFASSRYDHAAMLRAIHDTCGPRNLVGSSSAGEFVRGTFDEGSACAIGLRSSDLQLAVGLGTNLVADPAACAASIARGFISPSAEFSWRAALVLSDTLAGRGAELVEQLTLATGANYQFFGGGAGDDARFQRTVVFHGNEVHTDAAVALQICSRRPIGIGAAHGWDPIGPLYRVTSASGTRIATLNGRPAVEAYEQRARQAGLEFDRAAPLPFFLHCVIGIRSEAGWRLRVPLEVETDGALRVAAEISEGAIISLMDAKRMSAAEAAGSAVAALQGHVPRVALFFDCVATRMRLGPTFASERLAVETLIGDMPCIGCNTYGQIVRHPGQYNGFHNCTAVVCALA
jgi:hypothetical protein